MDPARERRLEELFHAAGALPAAERTAFVAESCGEDGELRTRLAELLAEEARGTQGVLARELFGPPLALGAEVGPYRLLEVIGEGGMGVVYLAEQREPIQRRVALKTLRVARAPAEILARFAAERQALALLDHPNIAQIFDAGSTPAGMPWFAMEHAPGAPLDEYCDQARLGIAERIELFLELCEAVQHAHQKGVIHRDLKPANVLVVQRDGRATPKVIDFGISRAVAGALGPSDGHTAFGQIVGTYLFMSPEQAQGDEVDTRTDIWALGAMLEVLLCGAPPFEADSTPALVAALLREEAPAPSRRLRALPEDRARAIARARRTRPDALARTLSGDLDAIVLRALERDRSRRYASASELAADLRRRRAHEPVDARAPTFTYRASRFVRRHHLMVAAASIAFAGLLATVVSLAGVHRAEAARLSTVELRRQVDAARLEFLESLLFFEPDAANQLAGLLRRRTEDLGATFADRPEAEAVIRTSIGMAWLHLGDLERARAELEHARELQLGRTRADPFELFLTLEGLLRVERRLGRSEAAEADLDRLLALAVELAGESDRALQRCLAGMVALRTDPVPSDERVRALVAEFAALLPRDFPRTRLQPVLRVAWETGLTLAARGVGSGTLFLDEVERIARVRLDPEGPAFLRFLWSLANAYLDRQLPDPARALALGEELQRNLATHQLPPEHWLVGETERILAAARARAGR